MNLALKAALFLGIGLNLVGCGDDKETATNQPLSNQNQPLFNQMAALLENEGNEVSPDSVLGYYLNYLEDDGIEIMTFMKITNNKITFSLVCDDRYSEASAEIDISESYFGMRGLLTLKEDLATLRIPDSREGCVFPGLFEGDSLSYLLASEDQKVGLLLVLARTSEHQTFAKLSDL